LIEKSVQLGKKKADEKADGKSAFAELPKHKEEEALALITAKHTAEERAEPPK
jgi:hypothetical protein